MATIKHMLRNPKFVRPTVEQEQIILGLWCVRPMSLKEKSQLLYNLGRCENGYERFIQDARDKWDMHQQNAKREREARATLPDNLNNYQS